MTRAILIDGNHLVHRIAHTSSGQMLRTRGGRPSGIIHGVLSSICFLLDTLEPSHTYITWDRRSRHRNRLLTEYRAKLEREQHVLLDTTPRLYKESRYQNRTNADHTEFQEVRLPQMQDLQYIMPALGIRSLCVDEMEGDDLVGIASDILSSHGEVILVSNDHDLFQLLGPNVRMFNPIKKKFYTAEDFTAQFGIPPERYPEIMALTGDDGDDIPGIPRIGEKVATKLLKEQGDIVSLIEACRQAPKSTIMKSIPDYERQIKLAYEMSFIMSRIEEMDADQREQFLVQWNAPVAVDWDEIRQFCDGYELRTVFAEMKRLLVTKSDEAVLAQCQTLDELFAYWGDCQRCPLAEKRINLIQYEGNPKARIVLCGEAPRTPEDIRGECYIGKAGRYLDEHCLKPNGLSRDDLLIMYAVCCHAMDENGDGRSPSKDELTACAPRFKAQVRIIDPRVVVLVGDKALKTFFPEAGTITKERGADAPMEHPDYPGVKFVAVFDPTYLMNLRPTHSNVIKSRTDWKYIRRLAEEI
jgi:uracil-DNA glycosylase family 4